MRVREISRLIFRRKLRAGHDPNESHTPLLPLNAVGVLGDDRPR